MAKSLGKTVYGVVVIEGADATIYRTSDHSAMLEMVRATAAAGLQFTVVRKTTS